MKKKSKVTVSAKSKAKAKCIFSQKPNGREKGYKESVYYGVGKRPYADIADCRKAGIKIKKERISPSGAWYYITQSEAGVLIEYLKNIIV